MGLAEAPIPLLVTGHNRGPDPRSEEGKRASLVWVFKAVFAGNRLLP